jgi:integrase
MGVRDRRIKVDGLPEIEPFETNERVSYLTDEANVRLLTAAPAPIRPLFTVAIRTGLRRGKLLDLKWNDVDFVGQSIHVRESKSGEGRHVPTDSVVVRTLAGLRSARRERLRSPVVRQIEASGYVFYSSAWRLPMQPKSPGRSGL